MRINERIGQKGFAGFLLPLFAVAVYLLLIWLLSQPLLGWYFARTRDEKGLRAAASYNSWNDRRHYLLGRYYHLSLLTPDISRAIEHYGKAVRLNPLSARAWNGLSKAYQMAAHEPEAEYALERAVKLQPNDPDLMWEAGTFWLNRNMVNKAVSAFRQHIIITPDRQRDIYDLCWKLGLGNRYLLDSLVPDSYAYQSAYLKYLVSTQRAFEAQEVWDRLDKDSLDKQTFISYVNFLISSSLYHEAQNVWDDITGKIEGMVRPDGFNLAWNADFEQDMLNGGFDWSLREIAGADVFIDDTIKMTGVRSLGVLFDGEHNPEITIARQVVRVEPGQTYTLTGFIRTDSLTTTNGIMMEVAGHNCRGLHASTEPVTGTNFWRKVELIFRVPPECGAVTVGIRRAKSSKLDNKIEGTAWIDGITLKQQGDLQTNSSRKR